MPVIRSKSVAEIIRSLFFPAISRQTPRSIFNIKSKMNAMQIPTARTHSVTVAWLGTTRSYTFMVNSGVPSAIRLISKLASTASIYR
ncbi:hypothetical protein D3C75_807830 [compost metagenome]